jgi:phenylacetate-CoA ligase
VYDLGDSVLVRPDTRPCRNPPPAIRVRGRAADVLTFPSSRGRPIVIPPLLVGSQVDRVSGIERFQFVQTAQDRLRMRLRSVPTPTRCGRPFTLASHGC